MGMSLLLYRAERRRLERISRETKDAGLLVRCRVVLKVASGCSARQAAREIGCVPSTAWQIITRYQVEGEALWLRPPL